MGHLIKPEIENISVKPNSQKQKVEWWFPETGGGGNEELLSLGRKC